MAELPLPVWDQRELPSAFISSVGAHGLYGTEFRVLASDNAGPHHEAVTWINEYRKPALTVVSDALAPTAVERLETRGIYPTDIATIMSALTNVGAYPAGQRIALRSGAGATPAYTKAVDALTPGFLDDTAEAVDSIYNPLLGTITVSDRLTSGTGIARSIRAVADNIGQAMLGDPVDLYVRHEPHKAIAYGHGYQWRYNGDIYGGMIQRAITAKLASIVQDVMGVAPAVRSAQPYIGEFRTENGYYYEDGFASALNIIATRLNGSHTATSLTFYQALWAYGRRTNDEALRLELQRMIRTATDGALALEDFERVPVAHEGMPLSIMQRVEEACGVDVSERPSRGFMQ